LKPYRLERLAEHLDTCKLAPTVQFLRVARVDAPDVPAAFSAGFPSGCPDRGIHISGGM